MYLLSLQYVVYCANSLLWLNENIMATERKVKTTVKKSSEPKHVRESKSSKVSSSPHPREKKTPDPGPMKGK